MPRRKQHEPQQILQFSNEHNVTSQEHEAFSFTRASLDAVCSDESQMSKRGKHSRHGKRMHRSETIKKLSIRLYDPDMLVSEPGWFCCGYLELITNKSWNEAILLTENDQMAQYSNQHSLQNKSMTLNVVAMLFECISRDSFKASFPNFPHHSSETSCIDPIENDSPIMLCLNSETRKFVAVIPKLTPKLLRILMNNRPRLLWSKVRAI